MKFIKKCKKLTKWRAPSARTSRASRAQYLIRARGRAHRAAAPAYKKQLRCFHGARAQRERARGVHACAAHMSTPAEAPQAPRLAADAVPGRIIPGGIVSTGIIPGGIVSGWDHSGHISAGWIWSSSTPPPLIRVAPRSPAAPIWPPSGLVASAVVTPGGQRSPPQATRRSSAGRGLTGAVKILPGVYISPPFPPSPPRSCIVPKGRNRFPLGAPGPGRAHA